MGVSNGRQSARQQVGALADEDESIRWLAGSSLVRFGSKETVEVLRAYLAGEPTPEGRKEARRVLAILVETGGD